MDTSNRPVGGDPKTPTRQQSLLIPTFKRGHRPTDSGVSCLTTVSLASEEDMGDLDEEGEEDTKDPKTPQRQQSLSIPTFKRGHRPTDSGVSCLTTVSLASEEDMSDLDEELEDFYEEVEDVTFKPSHPGCVKLDMPSPIFSKEQEQQKRIPGEPLKTLLSAFFLGAGFLATTISLAFTHERVPETEPLPDLLLDHVKYQEWGLDVSEVLLMLNTSVAVIVVMLHSHRTIILRRIWLILGLLYFYRAVTMCVTVLPKADMNYTCMPKKNETSAMMYVKRVLTIISGGGLSISGKHVFCGDYIFSGHTMTLTLAYLVIKQYSPKRFVLLHRASFLSAVIGVILLLLARGHYTIDVLLAYYVSSRLWWVYHTLAHNDTLKRAGPHNLLTHLWWWTIFAFFETKTSGPLPNKFSLPLPLRLRRFLKAKICRQSLRDSGVLPRDFK